MMDDRHNPHLRERSKKDISGVTSSHGMISSIVRPSSRYKRTRHGSHEKQVHVRNSLAEEVGETTEFTEMVVSEDDDHHPPPILPRRSGEPRHQSKVKVDP